MDLGNLWLSLPLGLLAVAMTVVLLRFHGRDEVSQGRAGRITALGFLASLIAAMVIWPGSGQTDLALAQMLLADGLGGLGSIVVLLCGLVSAGILAEYLRERHWNHSEIQVLMMLCVAGMLVMITSDHLAIIFLGLEVMSLSLYVLTAAMRERESSVEAGTKYFLTGAFASGLLLMGIAILFGISGHLDLPGVGEKFSHLHGDNEPLALVGWLLVIAGFGFKIAAVPFHQWVPDVYDGAPTPLTGFMSTAVKVAGFVALTRFVMATGTSSETIAPLFGGLAVLTMIVGNVGALAQTSVKRMLAYSSISHGGYLLLGIAALAAGGGSMAAEAVVLYLTVYAIMNIGAFAVLGVLEARDGKGLGFEDLAGLRARRPWLAAAMMLFMISLAGVPPTGGFLGKWKLFEALSDRLTATDDGFYGFLMIMLALNSVVGLGYYLRVVIAMYMQDGEKGKRAMVPSWPRFVSSGLIALCALLVVWLGVGPSIFGFGAQGLLDWVQSAVG